MELLSIISPLIQSPAEVPAHMEHLEFYNPAVTKNRIWQILTHPKVYAQVKKSCKIELRKSQIKTLEDIIVDTFISRIDYIQRKEGLPFPKSGSDIRYKWEGWFVLMFKNAAKTALEKERKATAFESIEEREDKGKAITSDSFSPSPEESLLVQDNEIMTRTLSLFDYLIGGERIKPQMRLYMLMLKHPESITYEHFQQCASNTTNRANPFYRSLAKIWEMWPSCCDELLRLRDHDNEVQTLARNQVVYLLFGKGYNDQASFYSAKKVEFDKLKDRIRKNINRCTYQLHKARIAYTLEHLDIMKDEVFFRSLFEHDLRSGMILNRSNMDQMQSFIDTLFSLFGEKFSHRSVGAILHLEHHSAEERLIKASNAAEKVAKNLSSDFKNSRKK